MRARLKHQASPLGSSRANSERRFGQNREQPSASRMLPFTNKLLLLSLIATLATANLASARQTELRWMPKSVSSISTQIMAPQRLIASGSTLALAGFGESSYSIELFNIADPTNPISVSLLTNVPFGDVAFGGGVIVVAPYSNTVHVYDARDPAHPQYVMPFNVQNALNFPPSDEQRIQDIQMRDNIAYIWARYRNSPNTIYGDLYKFDFWNPATPVALATEIVGYTAGLYPNLHLIDGLAISTGAGSADAIYFDISESPQFRAWGLTWNCASPPAFANRRPLFISLGNLLQRVNLAHSTCAVSQSLGLAPDGLYESNGVYYIVSAGSIWIGSESGVSLLGNFGVGSEAIERAGSTIYTAGFSRLFIIGDFCARTWRLPSNGSLESPDSWVNAVPPTSDSSVVFPSFPGTVEPTYTVTADNDLDLNGLAVLAGKVTLDLQGNKIILAEPLNASTCFQPSGSETGGTLILANGALSESPETLSRLQTFGVGRVSSRPRTPTSGAEIPEYDLLIHQGAALLCPYHEVTIDAGARVAMSISDGMSLIDPKSYPRIDSPRTLIIGGSRTNPELSQGATPPAVLACSAGTVAGDLTNAGDVRLLPTDAGLEGSLNVEGDFEQTDDGLLEVTLLGADAFRGQATALTVTGESRISGTLHIKRAPEYIATAGDYFTIVTTDILAPMSFFSSITGICETGREDLFWGVDYNRRESGSNTIQIVALKKPLIAQSNGPGIPLVNRGKRKLIAISHGTAGTTDDCDPLGKLAQLFARFAFETGLTSEWEVLKLDWREFATNAGVFNAVTCDVWGASSSADSRHRSFDPYEAARFGQSYARSLIHLLVELGFFDPSTDGAEQGLAALHILGHSSGSFAASECARILLDDSVRPNGATRPEILHVTLFDSYLPPQTGGAFGLCADWRGPCLGDLAIASTDVVLEQYFNKDAAFDTNNNPPLDTSRVANFDLSSFPLFKEIGASGHSLPQRFYDDALAWFTDDSAHQYINPARGIDAADVFRRFGPVFSPIFRDANLGLNLPSPLTPLQAADGDIDVVAYVRSYVTWKFRFRIVDEFEVGGDFVSVDEDRVRLGTALPRESDKDFGAAGRGASSLRTGTLDGATDQAFNRLHLSLESDASLEGSLAIIINGRQVHQLELGMLAFGNGPVTLEPIELDLTGPGALRVEFTANYLDHPAFIDFLDLSVDRVEQLAEVGCDGDADASGDVGMDDIVSVVQHFLADYGTETGLGDADYSGQVDFDDITHVIANWGISCP